MDNLYPKKFFRNSACLIGMSLFCLPLSAQIMFTNPSFEGSCSVCGGAPPGWTVCAATPDVLPGCYGVNGPAENGSTYIGFSTGEYVGQLLPVQLKKDVSYTFTVQLAFSLAYSNGMSGGAGCMSTGLGGSRGLPGRLEIWGGLSSCAQTELLYVTPLMDSEAWKQFTITFTPALNNYNYIMFKCPDIQANVIVDNLTPIQVVPVRLVNFIANPAPANVSLSWSAADDEKTKIYIIEKSLDGKEFSEFGTVSGAGKKGINRYVFSDHEAAEGDNYYRLKMTDYNGNSSYLGVVSARKAKESSAPVFPVNISMSENALKVSSIAGMPVTLKVLDLLGKEVGNFSFPCEDSFCEQEIDLSGIPAGLYCVMATDGISRPSVHKILLR